MKDWVRGYYAIVDLLALDLLALDLLARDLLARDLLARDLLARDLLARDLPARDLPAPKGGEGAAAAGRALLSQVESRAEALLAARPCCLQLRAKSLGAASMRDAALYLKDRCRAAGVPFCVNDRLDVALAVGADVVHLGQDDLPLADARGIAAGRLAIGFSTHNPAQAAAAVAGGADYIGFGPIFGTRSKLRADPTVGVEGLRAVAAASPIPVVAIGGITLDTVASVAAAGAAAAAVIAAVNDAPDPAAAGRQVAAAFR